MTIISRWPARIAMLLSAAIAAAVFGAWDAQGGSEGVFPFAQQTTASPSPTPCEFEPLPPPVCPTPQASASTSPSPRPSGSTSPSPRPSGNTSPSPQPSGSPTPGAEPERYDSEITIKYPGPAFKGVVRSASKCKGDRRVVLQRVRKGPDELIGRDTTGADGKWNVREADADGRYYAKVLKRVFMASGTQVTCRGDRSPTRRL